MSLTSGQTDLQRLTGQEAHERLAPEGDNEFPEAKRHTF